jgi:hypothetical protein
MSPTSKRGDILIVTVETIIFDIGIKTKESTYTIIKTKLARTDDCPESFCHDLAGVGVGVTPQEEKKL